MSLSYPGAHFFLPPAGEPRFEELSDHILRAGLQGKTCLSQAPLGLANEKRVGDEPAIAFAWERQ